MDSLYVILTTTGSALTLFILTKLMGYREISELSLFDYINGITIGSIAAEMATDLENFEKPLIAMVIYAAIILLSAKLSEKFFWFRRMVTGTPLILMDEGTIYYENMKKAKLDLGELMVQCRNNGYFDISQIQTIILESNGKMSILPRALHRPVTCTDLELKPDGDYLVSNIVIDGHIIPENLKQSGHNEAWLLKQLKSQNIKDLEEILLITCTRNNKLTIYKKISSNTAPVLIE